MSEVLVLVDHVDGAVRKPALELLTLARRLGEPSAVLLGGGDATAELAARLGEYGAAKVYAADAPEFGAYLVVPKVDALEQIARAVSPAAVLVTSSGEGKEVAARMLHRRSKRASGPFVVVNCATMHPDRLLETFRTLVEPQPVEFAELFRGDSLPAGDTATAEARRLAARDLADELDIPIGNAVDFWTEAALFSAAGYICFVYGPGDIAQAHTADEWVSLEQLKHYAETIYRIVEKCGQGRPLSDSRAHG